LHIAKTLGKKGLAVKEKVYWELLAVPALHRDGRQLSCEFSIVMITDEKKRISAVLEETVKER